MSLILPGTALTPDQLRDIYAGNRSGVVEVLESLEHPAVAVVDEGGRLQAWTLGTDVLRLLPPSSDAIPDARLADYVNVSYDLMVVLIELMKRSLDLPQVPGGH